MSEISAIPKTEHWAVVTQEDKHVYHEADERSRTNPGHGYPAYTETIHSLAYEAFKTEALALEHVELHSGTDERKTFRVLHVLPVSVRLRAVAVKE